MGADLLGNTGIVKLERAFSPADAARMRDAVWGELARRHGIERDDPTTWYRHPPTGLTTTKKSGAFAPICGPVLGSFLDALFGPGAWRHPKHFGNVLVTMPNALEWRVPDRVWHSDFQPTLATDRVRVVKLWALFDDVDSGGGGTPQLAGSHRAFARWVAQTGERDYKRAKFGFLESHPWLRMLTRDDGDPDRNRHLLDDGVEIEGVELRVMECTGRAGDVYVTHPWVFHSIAPNATARPRLMRSVGVAAADAGASDFAPSPDRQHRVDVRAEDRPSHPHERARALASPVGSRPRRASRSGSREWRTPRSNATARSCWSR